MRIKTSYLKGKLNCMERTLSQRSGEAMRLLFFQAKTTQIENMLKESEHISHNIEFDCSQLRNRFDMATCTVNENERKRKAKRIKEQRSKNKKKRSIVKKSKVDSSKPTYDSSTDEDTDVIDILDDEI